MFVDLIVFAAVVAVIGYVVVSKKAKKADMSVKDYVKSKVGDDE